MDTNRKIVKALLMKDYAALKEGVFSTLYTKASLALNEARRGVAEAVFNEAAKTSGVPGKVLKRKPKGKTHGFGSPAFERGQGWMGMQGY